ncbi:protein CHROMATIN REMODELING 8-like isoform X2 [Magnolia sinica]|uniref:protein CHROMATIN REMODELING 8-like isoform X2 n=1 Tax=Magnolia sinica TaxID=86752 RepID=UPI0026588880|nr:protein CHROMATIN REMODELING 8-like isoform X2 [Magnolia sinica]
MEEEEDKLLLSSLGVTSANPEDIERGILTEVKNDAGGRNEATESTVEQFLDEEHGTEPSATARDKLFNKLRAVEVEIDAVAASVKQARNIARNENNTSDSTDNRVEGDLDDSKNAVQDSVSGLNLQHALAADRLRSLKKTKAQLQKDLSELHKNDSIEGVGNEKLLDKLVREETKQKRRLKEIKPTGKGSKKRQKSVAFDEDVDFDAVLDAASAGFIETERDKLVRKGVLTPFHKLKGFERRLQQPGPSNRHGEPEEDLSENLISTTIAKAARSISEIAKARPTTKLLDASALPKLEAPTHPFRRLKTPLKLLVSPGAENSEGKNRKISKRKRPLPDKKWRKAASQEEKLLEGTEDAGEHSIHSDYEEENQADVEDADINEPTSVTLEGGLKIPETIFTELFDYQKVGVQWLWELHCQRAGGIIGDEMGLGKTIQVLSFLGALHFSKMYKPSIIICPVTLLRQWRREARKWYPSFRVEILHDSAQIPVNKKKQAKSGESDEETDGSLDSDSERTLPNKGTKKWDFLINRVLRSESGLLITTYEQLRILGEKLLDIEWGYAILDEGHRIRNPNAEITLVCKQLQTVHRIIMTGAPIQNKLSELWSLFDFVFPGKLGVLPVFETEFAVPISVGGYANATPLQVSTAYRCAVVLRDMIMPYLLRRMKADVNAQLPKKTEHVLFCSLTAEQRSAYRAFLASSEVEQIFDGNRNSLYGIDVMRKICNHPDLLEREHCANNPDYGNPERSGKMKVVEQVLKVWKEQGHRVLFFAQTQQMLDILEKFLMAGGYTYRRMDGLTPVKQRMSLIDEFNNSTDVFIFILTTKVGGLGTNLTGANRVIIFDPDWNPSTDMQARERAWRIGQTRDVVVYRLITRGTIEEKVYHRQIYKHFLTNKILKNPQQRRFFKARDMKDLFTLQDDGEGGSTETSTIFGQLSDDVNVGVHDNKVDKLESSTAVIHTDNAALSERTNSSKHGTRKGKEKAEESDGEVDEETNVLKSLFDAQGIHSAMNHDVIMNANDGEKMRLEEQANQVAKRAAEALRKSRMLRSQEVVYVPTWTGRSGAAGAPSSVRKKFGSTVNSRLLSSTKPPEGSSSGGGTSKLYGLAAGASTGKALSSAELLARIRGTQERAVRDGLEHQVRSASDSHHGAQPKLYGLAAGASTGKALSSAELLARIRGTQERAVRDGLERQVGSASDFNHGAQPKLYGLAAGASTGKALSSAELLARIRGTQERAVGDGLERQVGSASDSNHGAQPKLYGLAAGASTGKALSSAELLARIRGTQERVVGVGLERQVGSASDSNHGAQPTADGGPSKASHKTHSVPEVLTGQLCTFIQLVGGSTTTAAIVKHFKDKIPSKDLPLFKDLLKEIATLKKDSNGGTWFLKPEYKK